MASASRMHATSYGIKCTAVVLPSYIFFSKTKKLRILLRAKKHLFPSTQILCWKNGPAPMTVQGCKHIPFQQEIKGHKKYIALHLHVIHLERLRLTPTTDPRPSHRNPKNIYAQFPCKNLGSSPPLHTHRLPCIGLSCSLQAVKQIVLCHLSPSPAILKSGQLFLQSL